MAASFSLDGSMIPRQVRRLSDERAEPRIEAGSGTAVLAYRGRNHVVRICNLSQSGAMISFLDVPNIGETVSLPASFMIDRNGVLRQAKYDANGALTEYFAKSIEEAIGAD